MTLQQGPKKDKERKKDCRERNNRKNPSVSADGMG